MIISPLMLYWLISVMVTWPRILIYSRAMICDSLYVTRSLVLNFSLSSRLGSCAPCTPSENTQQ